jgi:hypothetical protein
VNVLLSCVFDVRVWPLYWAIGLRSSSAGNGWIGQRVFFLHAATPAYKSTSVAFLAFFLSNCLR